MVKINQIAATYHRHLCECETHGYTQGSNRWGDAWRGSCEVTEQGKTGTFWKGDRDCSSSVIDAWQETLKGTAYEGALDGATYTGNMRSVFVNSGLFEWGVYDFDRIFEGDILLNEVQHTAMYQSGLLESEFLSNEFGGITGGQSGDQTGGESVIRGYRNFPWDGVLYYNHKADYEVPKPEPTWFNAIIFESHGRDNQKWILNKQDDGSVTIESVAHPGFVLDVEGARADKGVNVCLWKAHGKDNQRWYIEEDGIRSALVGKNGEQLYLDVTGASDADLTNVEIWDRNDSDAQKWAILEGSDGYYTIVNNHRNAKKCLDVQGG